MRINLVDPKELSDQHLISEYMELGVVMNNIVKGKYKMEKLPENFCLGVGHIKFFLDKPYFLKRRNFLLWLEMRARGFNPKGGIDFGDCNSSWCDWYPNEKDIELSRNRVIESYKKKPNFYRWTLREKPLYL